MLCGSQNIVLNGKVSAGGPLPCSCPVPVPCPRCLALLSRSIAALLPAARAAVTRGTTRCCSVPEPGSVMLTGMTSSTAGGTNILYFCFVFTFLLTKRIIPKVR